MYLRSVFFFTELFFTLLENEIYMYNRYICLIFVESKKKRIRVQKQKIDH